MLYIISIINKISFINNISLIILPILLLFNTVECYMTKDNNKLNNKLFIILSINLLLFIIIPPENFIKLI